ncbi:MAG: hypothetical protein AAFW73_22585 [Bacteroidota bacterium]
MKNGPYRIALGLALTGVLLLVNEMDHFYNYLKPESLLLHFGLLGLVLALAGLGYWRLQSSTFLPTDRLGWSTLIFTLLGAVVLSLAGGSKLNRHWSTETPSCTAFEVIAKATQPGYRSDRYFLQVASADRFKEVTISEADWQSTTVDQAVNICDHPGGLGYRFHTLAAE